MGRRGWIDVALGALVAAASVTLWHFPLRDLWTRSVDIFGWSRPVLFLGTALIIVFHIAWLALAAYAATRSLQRPPDVWKRLYPVAVTAALTATAMTAVELLLRGRPALLDDPASDAAFALLNANVFYTLLWIAAWVHLRERRRETEDPTPAIWRRPGVWIWLGVWAVGLALDYLV